MKKASILSLLAGTTLLCALPISLEVSPEGTLSVSLDNAHAAVGRPLTATSVAGVGRRVSRRTARRAYYSGHAGYYGANHPAMATLASGTYAGGVYRVGAWDAGINAAGTNAYAAARYTANIPYYPPRAVYARGAPASYYGPICNPRFDALCQ